MTPIIKITRKREGYSDDASLSLHKSVSARRFIDADNFLDLLATAYTIELDDATLHKYTSEDVKESLKDIKVLGKKEIKAIIKWRERIRKAEKPAAEEAEMEVEEAEEEEDPETKIEHQIVEMQAAERAAKRQKKKKLNKIKEKSMSKIAKGLEIPQASFGADEDPNLFDLKVIKTKQGLESMDDQVEPIEDSPETKESESSESSNEDDDDKDGEEVESASEDEDYDAGDEVDEEKDDNPLLVQEEKEKIDKTMLWFQKIKHKLNDEDMENNEEIEVDAMATAYGVDKTDNVDKNTIEKDSEEKIQQSDGSSSDTSSSSDEEDYRELRKRKRTKPSSGPDEAGEVEVVPVQKKHKALTAAELALGQQLATSRKRKNELMDEAYHRYAWGDEDVPDWLAEDERKHYRKQLPVTKEQVAEYKQQIKEINARPIKKIAEAKAKSKYKAMKKLKKLSEQAEACGDENGQAEQVYKLKQMMKKMDQSKKKPETTYVVAKKIHGKHQKRPAGAKGKVKYVDPRMKKDTDGKKRAEQKKKGGRKPRVKNRVGHKPRSR